MRSEDELSHATVGPPTTPPAAAGANEVHGSSGPECNNSSRRCQRHCRLLRIEAGRDPSNATSPTLVGEHAIRSDEFRLRWAGHNVRLHDHGTKRLHHPVVGDLTLSFEELPLPADDGLTLTAYTAEPGTALHDGLTLLASWAATAARPNGSERAPTRDAHGR